MSWREGNGYLPLSVRDDRSGNNVAVDVKDVDKFDGVCAILSLCKLVRDGFKFYLEGVDNCFGISPDGQTKIKLDLGIDNILRIPQA